MKLRSYLLPLLAVTGLFSGMSAQADEVTLYDVVGRPCPVRFDKFGPREAKVGDFITYTIRIQNLSSCIFTRLDLLDILPERTQFRAAFPQADEENIPTPPFGGELFWNNQHLGLGETIEYRVRVHVVGQPRRTITNTACLRNQHLGPGRHCVDWDTRVTTGNDPESEVGILEEEAFSLE